MQDKVTEDPSPKKLMGRKPTNALEASEESPAQNARKGKFKELIAADINMSQLSGFMNQIIQVVNQHAKLLDTVSYELNQRPRKTEVGDMFNILSFSFPHEQVVQSYGSDPAHP